MYFTVIREKFTSRIIPYRVKETVKHMFKVWMINDRKIICPGCMCLIEYKKTGPTKRYID